MKPANIPNQTSRTWAKVKLVHFSQDRKVLFCNHSKAFYSGHEEQVGCVSCSINMSDWEGKSQAHSFDA
jgi:hypothetical protein